MSVQSLYTAATGMEALETKLDVIANNLANVSTLSFKKDRANFEDLFYRNEIMPGTEDPGNANTPIGLQVGLGTRVSGIQRDFGQGAFQLTSRELDVAIEGKGFFQVNDQASSQTVYTRAGNFSVNADQTLVVGSATNGRPLEPQITIPPEATNIQITSDGKVMIQQPGDTGLTEAGQLQIANFINPEGLLKLGDNLYAETDASGSPSLDNPGNAGLGNLQAGVLERSNVEPVQELIDLITTQRAFELNSQAVQAGDEVLQLVANLRRL